MKQAVTSWLDNGHIQASVPRCNKSLNDYGDYVEVWCAPSAAHMSCIHRSSKKFYATIAFATSFLAARLFTYTTRSMKICTYVSHVCSLTSMCALSLRIDKNRSIAFKVDPSKAFPRSPDPSAN